jgi:hypothetical protein
MDKGYSASSGKPRVSGKLLDGGVQSEKKKLPQVYT